MKSDVCAFILTHGRPDSVTTYKTLRKQGYTGKIYIVIDDEDPCASQYYNRFGAEVLEFSKSDISKTFDIGDNFRGNKSVVYARNAIWGLAQKVGCEYFIELDDDYTNFYYRIDENGFYGNWWMQCDWLFEHLCSYLGKTPFVTIAISQGGDHIGGGASMSENGTKRKAMNTFICKTDRQFTFLGRINEDTTSYVQHQRAGVPFLTIMAAQVNQSQTQSRKGGLTDIYEELGTYVKSFYSVMYCPSAVTVSTLKDCGLKGGTKSKGHARLHHKINWNAVAPKIIHEKHKKKLNITDMR